MSLNSFPNEVLLQIFKDLYPAGAFDLFASYKLSNEDLYQPPDREPSVSAGCTSLDRGGHYMKALLKADMAMRSLAGTSHRFRELSRDILVLRARATLIVGPIEALAGGWTWGIVVRAVSDREDMLARMLERSFKRHAMMA